LWKPLLHSVAAGAMDPSEHQLNYLAQGIGTTFAIISAR
jgi:NADH dehydrogenase